MNLNQHNKTIVIDNKINCKNDIDAHVDHITKNIQDTIDKTIPKCNLDNNINKLLDYIIQKIKIRNYYCRKCQRSRRTEERDLYTSLLREVRSIIKEHHNKIIENKLK